MNEPVSKWGEFQPPLQVLREERLSICVRRCVAVCMPVCVCVCTRELEGTHMWICDVCF